MLLLSSLSLHHRCQQFVNSHLPSSSLCRKCMPQAHEPLHEGLLKPSLVQTTSTDDLTPPSNCNVDICDT